MEGIISLAEDSSKDNVLDVRSTICPYPQLKTKIALDRMNPGETLKILTDDRESANNIRTIVEQLGDTILEISEKGKDFTIVIQKSKRDFKSSLK
ncbi:MAG: sulfurtransferase TusA family protein, partial [Candidatus Bathyarchaeia archaeon]